MNFEQQAQVFLTNRTTRNRNPIKPSTLVAYQGRLKNHILPAIGSMDIAAFGNGAMKEFASGLTRKGLSPKTVLETVILVQQVVSSAVSLDGNRLYPREWNFDFLDLPPIVGQKQPIVIPEQMQAALSDPRYGAFYAFLAGTGLRIGEALACRMGIDGKHTGWSPDLAMVDVQTRFWRDQEGLPKTFAGIREVDLNSDLNARLRTYMSLKKVKMGDFLFQSSRGGRLSESTIRKDSLVPLGIEGFHSFRRFRVTHMRGTVPEAIIQYWIGHAGSETLDRYTKLKENVELRKIWAAKAGLGFEL